jgi:hypothetical protein
MGYLGWLVHRFTLYGGKRPTDFSSPKITAIAPISERETPRSDY